MSPEAAAERALALLDLQRPQEALEHLHQAVATDPEVPQLHCLIALAKLQLEDSKGAVKAAEAAVAADPEEEWAHRLRSIALIQVGRKGEARDAALEAARLAPDEATTHVVLASALQAAGDEAGALAAARHAVALDPDDADTHATLGEVLFEQDEIEEAVDAYEAALRLNPEDADTLNNLAVARLRSIDSSGTSRQFEAAARLDPRLDVARYNILHTGAAGRTYVYRRLSTLCLLLAIVAVLESSTRGAFWALVAGAVLEFVRSLEVAGVSDPTRHLLSDDRRARRLKPLRWDWAWPTRLRSWWWVLFTMLPAPATLSLNVFGLVLGLAAGSALWSLVFGIALPFSLMRVWRWYRRRYPSASSWRPPA